MTGPVLDEHGRPETPLEAGEVQSLLGFLDFQRATFAWKCRGVPDAQLRAPLPPSALTLGGLLHHLAHIEDLWFTECVGEQPLPAPWSDVADPEERWQWVWSSAAERTGEELRALWEARVQASRDVVAARLALGPAALDATHPAWGGAGRASLRWVLLHVVEEYARHNGHADLLREAVDGEVGE
ncbi:MAG: mini-circle protein [Frankiales bacterium]|nr:mini-circle protein [Frankiales bacterium]